MIHRGGPLLNGQLATDVHSEQARGYRAKPKLVGDLGDPFFVVFALAKLAQATQWAFLQGLFPRVESFWERHQEHPRQQLWSDPLRALLQAVVSQECWRQSL